MRAMVARLIRRALAGLRGELHVDRMVAEGLQVGDRVFIARGVYVDRPWLVAIGEDTGLSPGVVVLAHDVSMRPQTGLTHVARVAIGKRVFVGAKAVILPGSTIGDDSIVGAGAVVCGEIPPGSMVVGNPAKVVSDVRSFAAWHRAAVDSAPVWPHDGWMSDRGITEERKRAQREALAEGISGYLRGSEVDGG